MTPVAHHGDAVGHRHRLLLVVRHVDEGRADVAVDLRELDLQPLAELQVERAERLVEQQHRGPVDERPRHRDALLLAAGQLAGQPVAELLEPDEAERLLDAPATPSSATRAIFKPKPTLSRTVMCGKSAYDWKTVLTRRR